MAPLPSLDGIVSVADCIRRNAVDPEIAQKPFLRLDDFVLSHADFAAESARLAALLRERRDPTRPFHLGILLENVPEYLIAFGACALAGATAVGINPVQRGAALRRDILHTDCQFLLTAPGYHELLRPIWGDLALPRERTWVTRAHALGDVAPGMEFGEDFSEALASITGATLAGPSVDPDAPYILVFTSGTTGAPKGVQISQSRMLSTGEKIGALMEVDRHGCGYLAMPLFHANSQQCGFMPALLHGASLGLIRRFSRSRWLGDVRRYGVTYFNYTGKPLSFILTTRKSPDDRENPLRIAYGNEGSSRILDEFSERFGCRIIDGFGATEGGFGFARTSADPANSVGRPPPEVHILSPEGARKPPGILDVQGRVQNPDEAIGEIVNTAGLGKFEGYYRNPEATAERTRGGMYWSGDFGFQDADGFLYFTGRDISWIRVDGENFLARPIEDALQRHPDVYLCAVYAVPDSEAGDRVMATLVLAEDATFDGSEFAKFLSTQEDFSPKWWPTFVRIATEIPQTATHKILKRELRTQGFSPERVTDPIFRKIRGESSYRRFDAETYQDLTASFRATGRGHLL
jgi:fatty-acyl-CoA synthase